jgi:type I restriction enzyme S subunit
MNAFEEIARPLREKIEINSSQIQTLSKLRDTLLPKLMKGEIRVKGFN